VITSNKEYLQKTRTRDFYFRSTTYSYITTVVFCECLTFMLHLHRWLHLCNHLWDESTLFTSSGAKRERSERVRR